MNKLLKHTPLKIGVIVSVVFMLVILIYTAVFFAPAYSKYQTTSTKLEKLKSSISSSYKRKILTNKYYETSTQIAKIEEKLDSNISFSDLNNRMNIILAKHNVNMTNYTARQEKQANGYEVLKQKISLEGEYQNIRKTMEEFKKLPLLTNITHTQFTRDERHLQVNAQLMLDTYRKQDGGAL